ncbi:MAG TPA: ribosomal protein S18-alanine N-acetyltransferase [Jatrophihabitantaceae bacterium]|nr:ribosomal protein S18-alanine N-acetyltransferase [Jatrophihabitantaceae bacterium]
MRIVPMTEAHLDEVLVYEKDMFGTESWSRSAYRDELRDTRTRWYIAAVGEDDKLLGWAGLMTVADSAQIFTVGTVPHARRQGVARRLIQAMLDEARRRAATNVFLEVRVDNEAAKALYEGFGFAPLRIRRGYYDGGRVDAVEMRLSLDEAS